jgi:hypothetical protein
MNAQRDAKRKKSAAKQGKATAVTNEKIKSKTAFTSAKVKEKAVPGSDHPLAKPQKALRATQVAAPLDTKQDPQPQTKRVSFVVRMTLDKHGQYGRTEIEHVSRKKKSRRQNFPSLDGERLVAFMKACISPATIPEDGIPTAPPRPKSSLIVSAVRVVHPEDPDILTLVLTPEEPFIVQARFRLQGPDSDSLTTQEPSYEMKVYANEVTSGKSRLLTTYSTKLIQDALEYTASAEVSGLPLGLYRLFTVVILSAPIKMAGFYGKTIVNVT